MQYFFGQLKERLSDSAPLPQVILGPRQVGKTTAIQAFLNSYKGWSHYASADSFQGADQYWLLEQWQLARSYKAKEKLLVIDEVQKVNKWSEAVKKLIDEDKRSRANLKIVLLGSSSLNLQKGLSESLTGRFEEIRAFHWSYLQSKKEFNFSLEDYLKFGGYPGSYKLKNNIPRWKDYINKSIVETVVSNDILRDVTIKSPALFRQAFDIVCSVPAQEISYSKLLGKLQDSGNMALVKNYLDLYEKAFLVKAIPKYTGSFLRQRASAPKLIPLCPALSTRLNIEPSKEFQGRVFEACIGAQLAQLSGDLYYWRDGIHEVDYVFKSQDGKLYAIEVKTSDKSSKGLSEFAKLYPKAKSVIINQRMAENFLNDPILFLNRA